METRTLGKTHLQVTPLGFGTAQIGFLDLPQAECDRLLNGVLDAGANVIDTAACYGFDPEGARPLVTKMVKGVAVDVPTFDPGSLWRYLCNRVKDPRTEQYVGPFLEDWPQDQLLPYADVFDGAGSPPSRYLADPWGHPYGFIGDKRRVLHNYGSFDIFSAGPDGQTACNNGIDDDLIGDDTGDGMTELVRLLASQGTNISGQGGQLRIRGEPEVHTDAPQRRLGHVVTDCTCREPAQGAAVSRPAGELRQVPSRARKRCCSKLHHERTSNAQKMRHASQHGWTIKTVGMNANQGELAKQ